MLHNQKTHPTTTFAMAQDALEANLRRGRQLRAEAIRSSFAGLVRALRKPFAGKPGLAGGLRAC